MHKRRLVWAVSVLWLLCFLPAQAQGPLRFRVTLPKTVASHTLSGRLIVFMQAQTADNPTPPEHLGTGFIPGAVSMAATELSALPPGGTVDFNPDTLAYPRPFSQEKPGSYYVMALLDTNHTYAYSSLGAGDLTSPVLTFAKIDPAQAGMVALSLDRQTPAKPTPADTESVKGVEFASHALTQFWGRPITMHAAVVLPPASKSAGELPTVYHIHGFGGNDLSAWAEGPRLVQAMADGKEPPMVHIFLDGSLPTGHHGFADSVNNGPWGAALTTEFIPYLEKKFRLTARPSARFLTGHSSGGWSTLWLQVTYPDFFDGTWSTAPDPVDLRSFSGVNVTPGSTDNFYTKADGTPRNLVRRNGKDIASIEEFAKQETVQGDYGGQFASFEWVWSPKGQDGRPLPLFNRVTGELSPTVERAWQKYDIRVILERHWQTLGPKLHNKLHLFCGADDTFHLNESLVYLKAFFDSVHGDATCEIVPGRDHFTLYQPYTTYPQGLAHRIYAEMESSFQQKPLLFGKNK